MHGFHFYVKQHNLSCMIRFSKSSVRVYENASRILISQIRTISVRIKTLGGHSICPPHVIAAIKSPNKSGQSGGEEKEEWRALRRKQIKRQRE